MLGVGGAWSFRTGQRSKGLWFTTGPDICGGSSGQELWLYGNPEKIRLKSCPGKTAVVQGELHFNTCGKVFFVVVLIQSVAAAEGEAREGGNSWASPSGAGWQGGEMVKAELLPEGRAQQGERNNRR